MKVPKEGVAKMRGRTEMGTILNGNFLSLREAAVEGGDVAIAEKRRVEERRTGVSEKTRAVSEKEVFKREADEGGKRMYADMGADENGSGRERILEQTATGVKIVG